MRSLLFVAGLALAGAAPSIAAADLIVANFAPSTVVANDVAVQVGSTEPRRLSYASPLRISLAAGEHRVRFDRAGAPAVEASITLEADEVALVVLSDDGGTVRAQAYDDESTSDVLGVVDSPVLVRHHVAAGDLAEAEIISEYECGTESHASAAGHAIAPGDATWSSPTDGAQECVVRFRGPFGVIERADVSLAPGAPTHLFLIGDDDVGYDVATIEASVQADVGGTDFSPLPPTPTAPGTTALLDSSTFWFDGDRALEGVSLFEVPGTGTVYGTWFGFEPNGRASWLALEGGVVYGGARRDLKVYEVSRSNGETRIEQVGSGTLQYADCNHAEIRLFLRGTELRTLRLTRSRAVDACVALDKGR